MQSSRTRNVFYQENNEYKHHKPIKFIENNDQRQNFEIHLPSNNIRSMSSSLRHSLRHLTSCASARKKTGRQFIDEHNTIYEEEPPHNSLKTSLLPTKSAPLIRQNNQSTSQDMPPALPPRKPVEKKNSVQMTSTIFNNLSEISSSTTDSGSSLMTTSRILPSKEISTSLVNLMGTASDSIAINNTIQPTPQENRRISAAPATTIDRLGLVDSLSNTGTVSMVESPSLHRTPLTGSPSYTKPTNDYSWCYESSCPIKTNSGTSIDECLPQLEIDEKPLKYRQNFESTEHFNWYGISENYGPVIISYKNFIDQNKQRSIMAIVRTRQRTYAETIIDANSLSISIDTLRRICEQCAITDIEYFDPVLCDGTHDLLLKYDESHVSYQHKFGIIYQRENQATEEDIFSNETHSIAMDKFLDLIGKRVRLKDFQGFRGGLDVKSDHTGTESVYEQFQNHEIMFHVSTLLPHSKSERQQLERKRHIGNDIVAIVFQEKETTFNPECIASQFLHVYLIVSPLDNDGTQFKVSIIHRDSVPTFGPRLHNSTIFHCDHIFKQWILTKLINAEMASCRASTFQKYQERTKMNLFDNLYRTLHENNRPLMNFVLCHSQYKHECDMEQQEKEENLNNSIVKSSDRHGDSSLLSSVRRRFIAPKSRVQNPTVTDNGKLSPSTTIIITPPSINTNNSRTKTRSMTMDLRRSISRESITTNGHTTANGNNIEKKASFFSSSKTNSPRLDKSMTSRSLIDQENIDNVSNLRSNSKFLSPKTCPSSPWASGPSNGFPISSNEQDNIVDSHSISTSILNQTFSFNNKLSSDDTDNDISLQFSPDDLQSSSKDDLIKFVLTLQQQHSMKLAHVNEIHSNALKRLQMELLQQPNSIDQDSP